MFRHDESDDAFRALAQGTVPVFPTGVRQAAELLVALASSDSKKAVVSAALSRKALAALSEVHAKSVETYWETAHKEAMEFLLVVLENNPKKSKTEIFNRADVQSALRAPYEEAAMKSEAALNLAWQEAGELTEKYVKAEFKLLKEDWQGYDSDDALLAALVGDLHTNAQAMRSRYLDALKSDPVDVPKALAKVSEDSTRRARYSATQTVWGRATDLRDSAFAKAGLNKVWVSVLDDKTCSHCKALHGTVVSAGEQFDIDAGSTKLKVYRGKLLGPPRHPNCRCQIVGTKLKKNKVSE